MIASYNDNKVVSPLEEFLYHFTSDIVTVFRQIKHLPMILAWTLGLVLLMTIGLIFTILFYVPVLVARKQTQSVIKNLLKDIKSLDERSAMKLHLEIEEVRIRLDMVVNKGDSFFIFLPIIHEFKKTADFYRNAEVELFKAAYPNYEKQLTADQESEVKEIFQGWQEDWADEKMDVYN